MARLTVGQKGQRVLQFQLGIRNRRARRALAAHGFTQEEFDEGFSRLKRVVTSRLDSVPVTLDPQLLLALDAWENRWLPIAGAVLQNNHPAIHEMVFRNLRQTEGPEVVLSVSTFVDRLDAVPRSEEDGGFGDEGRAALALLAKRGMNDSVLAEGRELLVQIGTLEEVDEDEPTEEDKLAEAAAEAAMWSWYKEWSAIARVAIRDRRLLRAMGFLRTTRRPDGTVVEEVVEDEDDDASNI